MKVPAPWRCTSSALVNQHRDRPPQRRARNAEILAPVRARPAALRLGEAPARRSRAAGLRRRRTVAPARSRRSRQRAADQRDRAVGRIEQRRRAAAPTTPRSRNGRSASPRPPTIATRGAPSASTRRNQAPRPRRRRRSTSAARQDVALARGVRAPAARTRRNRAASPWPPSAPSPAESAKRARICWVSLALRPETIDRPHRRARRLQPEPRRRAVVAEMKAAPADNGVAPGDARARPPIRCRRRSARHRRRHARRRRRRPRR